MLEVFEAELASLRVVLEGLDGLVEQVSGSVSLFHFQQHNFVYLGGLDVSVELAHHITKFVPEFARHQLLLFEVEYILLKAFVLIAQSSVLELVSLNLFLLSV